MNTNVELDEEKLEGHVQAIANMASEDLQKTLLAQMRAMLKAPPVRITVFDPLNHPVVEETINSRELAALYDLMNYAAHQQNWRPETVQDRVKTQFLVAHVGLIPRDQFQDVVDYLLEMPLRFDPVVDMG